MDETTEGYGREREICEEISDAHLLFLDTPLQSFYVVLYSHVDESVLGFSLHHPRALRTDHLDGLWHVDVTVHPCATAVAISASSVFEMSNIQDSPFSLMTSIRMSITIKVPVLPIPALENTIRTRLGPDPVAGSTCLSVSCWRTCSGLRLAQHPECSPASN